MRETNFSDMRPSRYELEGSDLYAVVDVYETKAPEEKPWESHKQYADIHFVVKGQELIGYSLYHQVKVLQEYDPKTDSSLFEGQGDYFPLREGSFVVFWPGELHKPGISSNLAEVKKVVVKVRV